MQSDAPALATHLWVHQEGAAASAGDMAMWSRRYACIQDRAAANSDRHGREGRENMTAAESPTKHGLSSTRDPSRITQKYVKQRRSLHQTPVSHWFAPVGMAYGFNGFISPALVTCYICMLQGTHKDLPSSSAGRSGSLLAVPQMTL